VQTLILTAQPPPVDARDGKQQTPLMKAAQRGHFKVVKCLLCWNADVDARDRKDRTPLMLGASSGCAQTVECVLHSNPKVNAKDKDGCTALMHAAKGNHRDVVKALLATPDIDLKATNRYGLEAGDVTTCLTIKGLLRVSGGVGFLAPLAWARTEAALCRLLLSSGCRAAA
jgi:ankyrin repeat protein